MPVLIYNLNLLWSRVQLSSSETKYSKITRILRNISHFPNSYTYKRKRKKKTNLRYKANTDLPIYF